MASMLRGIILCIGPLDNIHACFSPTNLDDLGGFKVRDTICVVFLHASGNGEDVGIKDDVVWVEPQLFHQEVVGPLAHSYLAFSAGGLMRFHQLLGMKGEYTCTYKLVGKWYHFNAGRESQYQQTILRRYFRERLLTCPTSSKAMMTTAAPNLFTILAFSRKSCSPSFRLMEFTILFPWEHFKPDTITSKLEESMQSGTWTELQECTFCTIGEVVLWRWIRLLHLYQGIDKL